MSEREFSPPEALLKIEKIIHSLNFSARTKFADDSRFVATAELFDKDNNLIDSGAGKGPDSLVGALAESIEHFSTFCFNADNISIQRCEFIASQKAAEHDGFLASIPCAEESIESFKLITVDKTKELFVPCILLRPTMNRKSWSDASASVQFLSRYASNSGIAFGCTKSEALLHGTNEVIERHILSRFFMAICSIGPALKLYAPSRGLLAKSLQYDADAIALADKLQVIIIKNVMNVFFSVAIPNSGPGDMHLSAIGSGCSLDICIAIQRAVTEQFQVNVLYDDRQDELDRNTLDFLASSNKLKNLIDFSPVRNIDLPLIERPPPIFEKSVSLQLEALEKYISRTGGAIYHRVVADYSNNGIVCQSYIPGLERFNLIRNGCLVVPQQGLLQAPKHASP